jgi:amino-acid N-acetyltransferase
MRTRKAILPDAEHIHGIDRWLFRRWHAIAAHAAEICENVRDFVVLEDDSRIIGCGALHLYGTHLAEIRSITVAPWGWEKAAVADW